MIKKMRYSLQISGVVQGVGFRPTVYRYAQKNNLSGFVMNTAGGVTIEIEGSEKNINSFIRKLKGSPPSAARMDSFSINELVPSGEINPFEILFSESTSDNKSAGISPDLATCPDCINDIFDKNNKRYLYPFTNCTNCGPRFTIVKDRPYDRRFTSMSNFQLCPECSREYKDPLDRRFHAQPNACPTCGPSLAIIRPERFLHNDSFKKINPIKEMVRGLENREIWAIKGLGGFHICCNPFSSSTVLKLRKKKKRPNKSFALMMKDPELVRDYCFLSTEEEEALSSNAAPIVLLRKKNTKLDHLSPDNNYLGVMLPYTPLHHLLLNEIPILLMTSANRRDEPLAINDKEAIQLMEEGYVSSILTHNREIIHRCDDSIVQFIGKKMYFLRRSRGYVPHGIKVTADRTETSLASGANLKNTFALRRDKDIFVSQHMGDLMDYRNLIYQKDQIDDFSSLLDIKPNEYKCDAHKGYENYDENATEIFHHHGHMLSVLAEYNLKGPGIIGVICDGTGLGPDGKIWGFEFLRTGNNHRDFTRLAHLDYFPLPGGEKAIYEIDRIAIALTQENHETSLPFPSGRIDSIKNLINSGINCPLTSSLGRLFDGVAALNGLTSLAEYEARGAILLQKEAETPEKTLLTSYKVLLIQDKTVIKIDYHSLIKEILTDLKKGVETAQIAWKFHKWTVDSIIKVLSVIKPETIVFSGGCFQNSLLTGMLIEELEKENYTYYFNSLVPPNDGGISLGQAYY